MITLYSKLRRRWSVAVGFLLLTVLTIYPLASVVIQSFFPHLFDPATSWVPDLQAWRGIARDGYTMRGIVDSVVLGVVAAGLATLVGTGFAIVVHRTDVLWRAGMDKVIWLIFFTPSFIFSEGWVMFLQRNGVLEQVLPGAKGIEGALFSPATLAVVMALKYFPFAYLAVGHALAAIGPRLEDAARMAGAGLWRRWRRINLPLLAPALFAGAAIAFAEAVGDFGFAAAIVPAAHFPLMTYAIFTALNEVPVNYPLAGALALVVTAITGVAMALQMWLLNRGSYRVILNQKNEQRPLRLGRGRAALFVMAVGTLFVAYGIPMISTFLTSFMKALGNGWQPGNWTLDHYARVLILGGDAQAAIARSLELAAGAALAAVVLGLWLAHLLEARQIPGYRWLMTVLMSTVAVPGIVFAAGFVFAYNAPWLVPLHLAIYGTMFCLFLAYVAGVLPYAVRMFMSALAQIHTHLTAAGRVLGARPATVLWRILFPLISGTAVSVFFMTFTGVLFELPASELLQPPGEPPFPQVLASLFNQFQWENGAALTVVAVAGTFVLYSGGRWIFGRVLALALPSERGEATVPASLGREGGGSEPAVPGPRYLQVGSAPSGAEKAGDS